ncbi:MAG: gamma-glutamyl-gamma-aminobutyrate hydrolase family protein [Desulfomonilaceae bacterium]|nr:gamma-glutamyl-gamma-aminobutyrate hydrolase family protein [Desulfomonilaceae bacterium]
MKGSILSDRRRIVAAVCLLCILVAGIVLVVHKYPRRPALTGLLIDLELSDPDPDRYKDLREAFTRKLPEEVAELKNADVRLDYVHFMTATGGRLNSSEFDFILLSPQGTPWYRYDGDAGEKLDLLKAELRELVLTHKKPVLGVCGGHQFLALAFGGTVDFIDPRFQGTYPDRYPAEAVAERGKVRLDILKDDPILRGVSSFPGSFYVMQSHYEEVKTVPEPFVNLARSDRSEAQLIRIPGLTVYGTAFHPERGWLDVDAATPDLQSGRTLLANFLTMVVEHKSASRSR